MAAPMMHQLSDLAEISLGAAIADAAKGIAVPIVFPRDVTGSLPPVTALQPGHVAEGARLKRATLRAGDVVVVARGPSPRSAVVGADTAGAVASTNLLIVRPHAELVSSVLVAFFQTREGQRRLVAAQTGATTPSLTVPALGRVEIPVLPLDFQRRLSDFVRAADEVLAAEERALSLRRELTTRITEQALAGGSLGAFAELELG